MPRAPVRVDVATLAVLTLGVSACSAEHTADTADAASADASASIAPAVRCTRTELGTPRGVAAGELVSVSFGPHGPRVFGTERWWDADGGSAFPLEAHASVAWTGEVYLVASARTVVRYDAALTNHHVATTLATGACTPTLVGHEGGAMLLWSQPATPTGACDAPATTLMLERFDASGNAIGAPSGVMDEGGHAIHGVARIDARWDAGRLVLATETSAGVVQTHIVAASGATRATEDRRGIACPLAGCVSAGEQESDIHGAPDDEPTDFVLRPLGRGALTLVFAAGLPGAKPLAVLGDRVIIAAVDERDAISPMHLALLDVRRSSTVAVLDHATGTIVTTWREHDAGASIRFRSAGDMLAIGSASAGMTFLSRIDCDP